MAKKPDLVFAPDEGVYYLRRDVSEVGGKVVPRREATPRDSFGRALDEPTVDDEALAAGLAALDR